MSVIVPETLDINALQSVPLKSRHTLPSISCVYFAISSENQVLYVGRSQNLAKRWKTHPCCTKLASFPNVRIAWIQVDDTSLLPSIESILIKWFKPELSRDSLDNLTAQHIKSPRVRKQIKIMPQSIENLELLGGGSISDGIDRVALQLPLLLEKVGMYLEERAALGDKQAEILIDEVEAFLIERVYEKALAEENAEHLSGNFFNFQIQ